MNDNQNPTHSPDFKHALASRIVAIRMEIYGEHGSANLATQLGLPHRIWADFESGATIPGEVLLRFLKVTSADVRWLLHGDGPKYTAYND